MSNIRAINRLLEDFVFNDELGKFIIEKHLDNNIIGQELADPGFSGCLYLTAEDMDKNTRQVLTDFCINLLKRAKGIEAELDIDSFMATLKDGLNNVIENLDREHIAISDDGLAYALNSLRIPLMLRDFCQILNTTDAEQVIKALDDCQDCSKAVQLADTLDKNNMSIKDFIKQNNIDKTEIGQEMAAEDFDGELYLTAEEFSHEDRTQLAYFCQNIIAQAMGDMSGDDLHYHENIEKLEQDLQDIMQDENIRNGNLSDDGFEYAISSLDMPNKLIQFCKAVDSDICKIIINEIENSNICKQAIAQSKKLANMLK